MLPIARALSTKYTENMARLIDTVREKAKPHPELEVHGVKGAKSLAWEPADPKEAEAADTVVVIGPVHFGALCRLGGKYRFATGRTDDGEGKFPSGEYESLDDVLAAVIAFARKT